MISYAYEEFFNNIPGSRSSMHSDLVGRSEDRDVALRRDGRRSGRGGGAYQEATTRRRGRMAAGRGGRGVGRSRLLLGGFVHGGRPFARGGSGREPVQDHGADIGTLGWVKLSETHRWGSKNKAKHKGTTTPRAQGRTRISALNFVASCLCLSILLMGFAALNPSCAPKKKPSPLPERVRSSAR